jgi:alpha-amylase/alpha-mannosidase (GH57 family)
VSGGGAAAGRFLAIHGHFYQPPRENPWLEEVEVEPGAAPYHDWNERITAECYAANTAARLDDGEARVVNNFEKISFNFGPTLLSWLDRHAPVTYRKIVEADRTSREVRHGHGNAIAQAYNHVIMPLASRRDKVTQVGWGIEDFRHRFGRDPEGMWLPETAVDRETLALLGDAGIRLTILAPSQAQRVRRLGTDQWVDVGGERIDPRQAYHHTTMRGRRLALFFYDGPISRAIAFEGAAASGETLAARLLAGFQPERTDPQLVHVATDGESYGHHTPRGETALAAALAQLERTGGLALTNYGEFLAAHPPAHEVEIADGTSWSCAHGVERWRSDCGCRVGHPGWHQRWRAPLREALDWLRDQLDPFYETRLSTLLRDPWAARDDYIHVILDRSAESKAAFFARHERRPMDHRTRVEALKFLELQRQRLLMYTSCGWFFDDIGGLEAVQVLKYAARAIQLADDLGLKDLEPGFLRRLAAAPSNVPEMGNGAQVYRRLVLPIAVDFARVVAHP